ncbi:Di-copper centre-containing protein [Colletotrichum zoysiae]|uniref:Di-copper centre-containing protein n=1 Tax=Colletotrichum zoysiae TaxID=1216348 RepID=A0AAD9HBC0_9PEZI|nr:Di-copper centre-containing protein [Colletotrichum zoysiae]
MLFPLAQSSSSQQQYVHVPTSDVSRDPDFADEKLLKVASERPWSRCFKFSALVCAAILGLSAGFSLGYTSGYHWRPDLSRTETPADASGSCENPYFRREWRSLSKQEKKDYLDAFQCFIDSPSVMGLNGSLYNDFSWVHNLVAHSTHTKAPFLTWHRRFIFVYEKYLQKSCGYKGAIPFWDWTLDWDDITNSPIFDSKLGFGGDGDPKAPEHQNAHCVTDLPFKNLRPQWYGSAYDPHCLSRSFNEDWLAHYMNPEALEKVMAATNYEEFYLALEMGPHDIIPLGIRGDFTAFTAPNDPIFYLHHAQLDRVWWLWQMRDKNNRVHDYGGEGDRGNVSLTDTLPLAGLDKDLTVADIMDTEGGEMCYRYMYS